MSPSAHSQFKYSYFKQESLLQADGEFFINDEYIHKTAITTLFSMFKFVRMPFDLRDFAQHFQRLVDEAHCLDFEFAHVDDVFVVSPNEEEHIEHLRVVFRTLDKYRLSITKAK